MFTKVWQENKFPITSFVFWRIALSVILLLAFKFVPLQENFLGGGRQNYLTNPILWSGVNFDGEHYLSIVQNGYKPLQYFYFPGYPLVVRSLAKLINFNFQTIAIVGLVVSNVSFLFALVGFWKLLKLDFKEKFAKKVLLLLLVFPTSFYFATFYTESLFFCLVIWSFYFSRTDKWLGSGLSGFWAALTRIIGIALAPALFFEALNEKKDKLILKFIFLSLIPLGLLAYMFYLYKVTGDPLEFFHSIAIFGQQRSASFILPPQVIYRYVFKVVPNLNFSIFPTTFVTFMEFISGFGFFVLAIYSFLKLRLSYSIYLLLGYLAPVFSGSFSSFPRYALVLFPGFILATIFLSKLPKVLQVVIFGLLFTSLTISLALFARGFWVA